MKQKYAARAASGEVKIDEQNGVRVDCGSRGWLHVRASNTEPIVRMIAEAPTVGQAEGMVGWGGGGVRAAASGHRRGAEEAEAGHGLHG